MARTAHTMEAVRARLVRAVLKFVEAGQPLPTEEQLAEDIDRDVRTLRRQVRRAGFANYEGLLDAVRGIGRTRRATVWSGPDDPGELAAEGDVWIETDEDPEIEATANLLAEKFDPRFLGRELRVLTKAGATPDQIAAHFRGLANGESGIFAVPPPTIPERDSTGIAVSSDAIGQCHARSRRRQRRRLDL